MSRIGSVVMVASLASCARPPAPLVRQLAGDARLPACATFDPASFRRDEGGGWMGGGYEVAVTADQSCVGRWAIDLSAHGFTCDDTCVRRHGEETLAIARRRGGAVVRRWSNT